MIIKWYMSDVHCCGYIRGEVLARAVNQNCSSIRIDCKTDVMLSDFYKTDIMVFQRQHQLDLLYKMRMAKDRGIKTVYEIDDDLFNIPAEFTVPNKFYGREDVRGVMASFLAESDATIAATGNLAKALKKYNGGKPTWVVENALDAELWEATHAKKQAMGKPNYLTIGWLASQSHQMDAPLVMPALERLLDEFPKIRMHFIGWILKEDLSEKIQKQHMSRIRLQEWVDIAELPQHMIDFDIGIAPLMDNDFNNCKSGIKAMQYWALGIPVVASPLAAYDLIDERVNGFKPVTTDDWYACLKELIENEEARLKMGAFGREKLLGAHDIRNTVGQWIDTFRQIMTLP